MMNLQGLEASNFGLLNRGGESSVQVKWVMRRLIWMRKCLLTVYLLLDQNGNA